MKLANIFMFSDGSVKLGDFNISRIQNEGIMIEQNGTPIYAAPEIYLNIDIGHKTDIWALGV